MSRKPPVLLIDDDEGITFSIATLLEAKGYPVTVTNSGSEGLRLASEARFPLVLSDIYIDRVSGLDILKAARQANPRCAVILITANRGRSQRCLRLSCQAFGVNPTAARGGKGRTARS